MTVGMNRLNQMFRDFKVAEDVGKMMELRRFEVEFEIFGTVFWQDGTRHYLVSKSEDTLYQQIAPLALENMYPLIMQTWHESLLVPAGWDEEIEQTVKVHFCKALQKNFPESFWKNVEDVTRGITDDSATAILDPLQEQLDGVFNADLLQLFESLLDLVYLRKNLTKRSYHMYSEWLKEVRQEMVDDVITKDLFSKDLYGFAYEDGSGRFSYHLNASQRVAHEKRDKHQKEGCLVTPIFHKKYWYNYEYRLVHVRADFKEELKRLFDGAYFDILRRITTLNVAVNANLYRAVLQDYCAHEDAAPLAEAWKDFGRQWGIVS